MASNFIVEKNTIGVLLEIFDRIQRAKDNVKGKAKYHFNALLNAEPDEPKVSKILAGFFLQETNSEYRVLKSFVKKFWGDNLAAMIKSPTISTEEFVKDDKRIDILVYEKDKYAIVMENKIWDALDQPNQLANYIEAMMGGSYNFNEDQIYVAYLPSTNEHQPSPNSWEGRGGDSYQERFKDRYKLLGFKEKILPWLESSKEVQEIKDNPHFEHSCFLFIDFLRRKLDIDNIDNMAQKEIEKQLREYFSNSESAIADAERLVQLIHKLPKIDINEVVKHLAKIRKEKTKLAMQEWLSYLQRDYPENFFDDSTKAHMAVGTTVPYRGTPAFFSVFIWNYQYNEANSVVIALTKEGAPYRKEIDPKVWNLVRGKKYFKKGHAWLYYKFVSFEQAYPLLQELVRELPNI
ncbi:MAG: PD-(D/E)XK nuclease family protein [Prevotella sp.]|nr:PD-(D/E)XK nuclease family protein [Prevotella sp.]